MKRLGLYLACGLGVAFVAAIALAQPVNPSGLQFVTHDATMQGSGTSTSPLKVNTAGVQKRVTGTCSDPDAIAAIAADGTVTCSTTTLGGTLTSPDLVVATGPHATGNYAGSTPAACSAGQAVTQPALSAAGALTTTCSAFVTGSGTSTDLTAWTGAGAVGNYGGSTSSSCAGGTGVTQVVMSAAGALTTTCSTFVNAVGTGLSLSGSTASLNINGGSTQTCGAGTALTALTGTGIGTCSAFATDPSGSSNTIAKFNGSGPLVNSGLTDDGTTISTTETVHVNAILLAKKMNYSPVNASGDLNTTNFEQAINSLTSVGQGTNTLAQFGASDNTGNVLTGLDASSASVGDIFIVCNTNAPTDDGVLALSNEDGNSTANDQFKTPDSGRSDDAANDHYTVANDTCSLLVYMTPNASQGDTTTKKWMVMGGSTRSTRQIVQLSQQFPAYDTEHVTGTVNDYGRFDTSSISQSSAVPNPKNGSSTSVGQNTTVASASNGHTLPQATIDIASNARFTTSGKGSTTIASGSNGQSLPQATINVASATSFYQNASLQEIFVTTASGVQRVFCTGLTSTTFTGCTGGTGAMSTGGAVVGTYYSIAIQATANTFLEYYYVQCTGSTSTTLTGCVGGVGVINTGNAVVNNPICEAGGSCFPEDYTLVRAQTKDSTGATFTGFKYVTNAFPSGLNPFKRIHNYGPGTIYLAHKTGSATNNQITTPNGAPYAIPVDGEVTILHTTQDNYWHIQGHTGHGEWIGRQVFTASATYTPDTGTAQVLITMCGQGGGGGGAQGTGGDAAAGGGGGAGELWIKRVDCGGVCTTAANNVVAANTGGVGGLGDATHGNDGTDGSTIAITITGPGLGTATYTAAGGYHGSGMTSQTGAAIALGGRQTSTGTAGADLESRGAVGENGVIITTSCGAGKCGYGGNGGSSPYGTGGKGFDVVAAGQSNAFGYCAGGSGGSTEYGTGFSGGNATTALLIVDEFN